MVFNGVVILCRFKDPSTNLWTLPIPTKVCTTPGPTVLPQPGPCESCAPHLQMGTSDTTCKTKLSKNAKKLPSWRGQKIPPLAEIRDIAKKSPSWRGQKIPPQAKICNINKKLPSWRGHKIPSDTHPGVSLATFTHSVRT
jgi:hypothetical protein